MIDDAMLIKIYLRCSKILPSPAQFPPAVQRAPYERRGSSMRMSALRAGRQLGTRGARPLAASTRMSSAPDGAPAPPAPAAPQLPDAICVHCGQRFNSAHLAYGVDTKKLPAEVRPKPSRTSAVATRVAAARGAALRRAARVADVCAAALHTRALQVAAQFVRLNRDSVAEAFLLRSGGRSTAVRWAQSAATTALRATLSLTDANGLVGRGGMHVLSTEQARTLLERHEEAGDAQDAAAPRGVLLDVGAGDGSVTAQLAPLFQAVVATEVRAVHARDCVRRGTRAR
jgi:hypothetical protein